MGPFPLALAGFVLLHVGVSATGLRQRLVGRIGEGPYRALFSLASIGVLTWMIMAYGDTRADPFNPLNESLWLPPTWLHWPAVGFGFIGIALAATGVLTRGPTSLGFEKQGLAREEPALGVHRITRHPFLWGVALWGVGHLLANGERAAVMLFGALTFMVIFGARSIDRKGRARDAVGWARFEDATSNVPFMAITQGRNRLALGEIGWRGLAGLAVAGLILFFHERLFGVAAISTSP